MKNRFQKSAGRGVESPPTTGVRLYVSDVDGTLLDRYRNLSYRTISTVSRARSEGHEFVMCSSQVA